jgi:hypothetical protein
MAAHQTADPIVEREVRELVRPCPGRWRWCRLVGARRRVRRPTRSSGRTAAGIRQRLSVAVSAWSGTAGRAGSRSG